MIITVDLLRRPGWSVDEILLFVSRWPDGMEVTVENVIELRRLGFSLMRLLDYVPRELELRFLTEYRLLGPRPWRRNPNRVAALYVMLVEAIEGPFPWPSDNIAARWRKSLE
jgi:hypothetical protein